MIWHEACIAWSCWYATITSLSYLTKETPKPLGAPVEALPMAQKWARSSFASYSPLLSCSALPLNSYSIMNLPAGSKIKIITFVFLLFNKTAQPTNLSTQTNSPLLHKWIPSKLPTYSLSVLSSKVKQFLALFRGMVLFPPPGLALCQVCYLIKSGFPAGSYVQNSMTSPWPSITKSNCFQDLKILFLSGLLMLFICWEKF